MTVDRLVDDVWAGDPPATAVNTLQSYVSLLRRALGDPQLLRREGPGYVLAVDRELLDAARFEDRVAAAARRSAGDPDAALAHLDAALGEWRGPVLADVADEDWARSGRGALGRAAPGGAGGPVRRPARARTPRRGGGRARAGTSTSTRCARGSPGG